MVEETLFRKKSGAGELIGRVFGDRYQVEALIGRGGMGWVFRGTHRVMEQPIALKVMRQGLAADLAAVKRFYKEARACSKLCHHNTIKVHDFGVTDDGFSYIVMEFLEGQPLNQVLAEQGSLGARRSSRIAIQVCRSLDEAHEQGIVHRDLKPGNIFLRRMHGEEDYVKVLDFGIAKFVSGDLHDETLTKTGMLIGTPRYASPEQAKGRKLDRRSDIYSLGIILYQMLAGRVPFDAPSTAGLIAKQIYEPPPPLPETVGEEPLPPALSTLVGQMLNKNPNRRPATAREVAERLADLVETGTHPAQPAPAEPPSPPPGATAKMDRIAPPPTATEANEPQHRATLQLLAAEEADDGVEETAHLPSDGGRPSHAQRVPDPEPTTRRDDETPDDCLDETLIPPTLAAPYGGSTPEAPTLPAESDEPVEPTEALASPEGVRPSRSPGGITLAYSDDADEGSTPTVLRSERPAPSDETGPPSVSAVDTRSLRSEGRGRSLRRWTIVAAAVLLTVLVVLWALPDGDGDGGGGEMRSNGTVAASRSPESRAARVTPAPDTARFVVDEDVRRSPREAPAAATYARPGSAPVRGDGEPSPADASTGTSADDTASGAGREETVVTLRSTPPGAEVRESEQPLGVTPLDLPVASRETRTLSLVLDGYEAVSVEVSPEDAPAREIVLTPERPSAGEREPERDRRPRRPPRKPPRPPGERESPPTEFRIRYL